MKLFYFFAIISCVQMRETYNEKKLEEYSIFTDAVDRSDSSTMATVMATKGIKDWAEAVSRTTALIDEADQSSRINSTEVNRRRRFGAWESDLSFPDTLGSMVEEIADPFDLREFLSYIPDVLITPFYVILLAITVIWNVAILAFLSVVGYRLVRLLFYVADKLSTLLFGCISKSSYKICVNRLVGVCFWTSKKSNEVTV